LSLASEPEGDVDEDEGGDEEDDELDEPDELDGLSQTAKVSSLALTRSSEEHAVLRQLVNSVSRPMFCWVSSEQMHSVSSMLLQPALVAALSKQSFYLREHCVSASTSVDSSP
jgi:hypothetical protein